MVPSHLNRSVPKLNGSPHCFRTIPASTETRLCVGKITLTEHRSPHYTYEAPEIHKPVQETVFPQWTQTGQRHRVTSTTYMRSTPMPGMFGADPPLMLIAIAVFMVAVVAFALLTAGN